MGNNPTSGTPGAPHWALTPVSMLWEGLSVGDLCRMLRNPGLNGNRSPEALIEHMATDRLVGWGWNPATSWKTARRVVAKVEFHFGELFPRVGFIVTNLEMDSRAVVRFYNKRGTAEQWNQGRQAGSEAGSADLAFEVCGCS